MAHPCSNVLALSQLVTIFSPRGRGDCDIYSNVTNVNQEGVPLGDKMLRKKCSKDSQNELGLSFPTEKPNSG